MSEVALRTGTRLDGAGPVAGSPPPRARSFTEILGGLAKLAGVRGGLIVAPDGLVITSILPTSIQAEGLAALGATLGRELERGAGRLGRGALRTAAFAAGDGMIVMGASPIGFLILLGDRSADMTSVRAALRQALPHLEAA